MEAEDWKGIATNYEENILSVYDNDQDRKIESIIKKLALKKGNCLQEHLYKVS